MSDLPFVSWFEERWLMPDGTDFHICQTCCGDDVPDNDALTLPPLLAWLDEFRWSVVSVARSAKDFACKHHQDTVPVAITRTVRVKNWKEETLTLEDYLLLCLRKLGELSREKTA